MPATEKTWYDQKLLHVVFGCTGLLMLISTIWMFAADHQREWKGYQRKMRGIDQKLTAWRLVAETSGHQQQLVDELDQIHETARSAPPLEKSLYKFKTAIAARKVAETLTETDPRVDEIVADYLDALMEPGSAPNWEQILDDHPDQTVLVQELQAVAESVDREFDNIQDAYDELKLADAQKDAKALRGDLLRRLLKVEKQARFRMDQAVRERKFAAAAFDAITAKQGLWIRDGKSLAADGLQTKIDAVKVKLDEKTTEQETTTHFRNQLKAILAEITAEEDTAKKSLTDALAESKRLANALAEGDVTYLSKTVFPGKKLLELPIADAFNSPLKITNLWTEGLTMPMGSFGKVRRFDRCTTCHRGIDKSAAGSSIEPAYEPRHEVVLQLPTPAAKPERGQSLLDVYGIILAPEGLVERDDVTVQYVAPNLFAASAVNTSDTASAGGLMVGDVISSVGGDGVSTRATAARFLLSDVATWGSTVEVIVERGLPEPYTSHPRLDLYVSSLSPHKMSDIDAATYEIESIAADVLTLTASAELTDLTANGVGISPINADPGFGTNMDLRGEISPSAPSDGYFTVIFGHNDVDRIVFNETLLGGMTRAYGSHLLPVLQGDGSNLSIGPDAEDFMTVNKLKTMGVAQGHTLTLDGQSDTDTYVVQTTGSQGALRNYVINVLDTGLRSFIMLTSSLVPCLPLV